VTCGLRRARAIESAAANACWLLLVRRSECI
jgi:hypothetical protein